MDYVNVETIVAHVETIGVSVAMPADADLEVFNGWTTDHLTAESAIHELAHAAVYMRDFPKFRVYSRRALTERMRMRIAMLPAEQRDWHEHVTVAASISVLQDLGLLRPRQIRAYARSTVAIANYSPDFYDDHEHHVVRILRTRRSAAARDATKTLWDLLEALVADTLPPYPDAEGLSGGEDLEEAC